MIEESENNINKDGYTSKSSDQMHIMFVCKKCGALCLTLPEYFENINPGDVIDNHLSQKITLSLISNDLSNEANNDSIKDKDNIFQRGLEAFIKLSKSPFFPWCLACTMELKDRVQSRVKYFKTAETFYSQLDIPQKSIFQEILEKEVEKLGNETSMMNDSVEVESLNSNKLNVTSRELFSDSDNLIAIQKNKLPQQYHSNSNSVYFKSLILPIVFHIGVKGTYGTINMLKLGQNKNWSISNDELDKSFFFLAQLVKNAGNLANIDVSSIQITTDVQIKINNEADVDTKNTEKKNDFFSKLQESLFGKSANNDTVLLKSSDMKKNKTLPRFNQALDVIFSLSSQIFESQNIQQDSMMPPNLISPEDHTIADRCYYFDPKDPDAWSNNMRLLLFNYAFMFTFCLRNAVISIQ